MSSKRERLESAGEWLRRTREQRGYRTLAEFARALGVDQSLVSRYERGVSEISDERAKEIADVLHMDLITVRMNLGLWVPTPTDTHNIPHPDHQIARELLTMIKKALDEDEPLPTAPRRPPSDWAYPDDPGRQLIHENPYLTIEEKVWAIRAINEYREQQPSEPEEPPAEELPGA